MKQQTKALAVLAAALFCATVPSACGGNLTAPCKQDGDCPAGEACSGGTCSKGGGFPDIGVWTDGGGSGADPADTALPDDSGTGDAALDAQSPDAGIEDAGATDAGRDAGRDGGLDGGRSDGGLNDGGGAQDAGGLDGGQADAGKLTASECYKDKINPNLPGPNYDQFNPEIGPHCMGTDHQKIEGVQKVVFLGDSITVGTPPYYTKGYRFVLMQMLQDKFGALEFKNCSNWGDRADDLLLPDKQQILKCFDKLPETKRTLVIMTVGGNDMNHIAGDIVEGRGILHAMDEAKRTADLMDDAIKWFFVPGRFTNGIFVVYADVYEFTDGTGDLDSCLMAKTQGLSGVHTELNQPFNYLNERFMKLAVETGTDMVFMLEHFCGHGFCRDNKCANPSACYQPGSEMWLDVLTCIHPNDEGHNELAGMFKAVIDY
jgi:hypothetical protein